MSADSPTPPASNPFDVLMAKAKQAGSQEELIEHFRALWKAFLELDSWIFLTTCKDEFHQAQPFVGIIEEQPWALAFTDPSKAAAFAGEDPRFRDSSGQLLFIGLPKLQAIQWVFCLQQEGVHGLRINQGEFGWFIPISNLPTIILDIEGQD